MVTDMVLLKVILHGVMTHHVEYKKGWLDPFDIYTNKIYYRFYLFGTIKVFSWCFFTEDVPVWAVIQKSCLGASTWLGNKPWLIDASQQKRVIKTVRA